MKASYTSTIILFKNNKEKKPKRPRVENTQPALVPGYRLPTKNSDEDIKRTWGGGHSLVSLTTGRSIPEMTPPRVSSIQ